VQKFDLEGVSTTFLFAGGAPSQLDIDSPVSVFVSPAGILRAEFALRPPVSYSITAVIPRSLPEDLVDLGREYDVDPIYFQLPLPTAQEVRQLKEQGADWEKTVSSASPRAGEFLPIYELNEMVVGEATDPYDIALRIERFLRSSFDYSLDLPPSELRSPYAAFLFDTRMGYCQQFSGVMTLLLRLNGIPSRVAVGFATGNYQGGDSFLVSTNNAHAWVEVYFPGVGWLPFDPTPGRNLPLPGVSVSSPNFTDPFAHAGGSTEGSAQIPNLRRDRLPETGGAGTGAASAMPTGQRILRAAGVLALGAALVAAWPWIRRWWRYRPARQGTSEERLRASLALLRADLLLWDVPAGPALTAEEVCTLVRREAGLELGEALARVQKVLYGGRAASQADVAGLERARQEVNAALARRRGRFWRVVVAYGGGRFLLALRGGRGQDGLWSGLLMRRAIQAVRDARTA
jgi:transglutaminase-like putative cysteine protease